MKDQINTIREALDALTTTSTSDEVLRMKWNAKAKLSELEAMVGEQEPVAWMVTTELQDGTRSTYPLSGRYKDVRDACDFGEPVPLYAAPVAQQYEAGDMASAAAQGFRDGVASVTQQPPKLEDIEQYRMQMAGISTAAMGYWKEGDSIHPDYDIPALRDVAKLYAKYDALYKAQQPQEIEVQCPVCNHKFYEWPNDKQPQAEAVPVVDRVYEAAKRLVDHADFQLGGVLSAKSKARDIPSNAASKVKARHLASLRDALAKTPQQAEAVQYTRADLDRAYSAGLVEGERLAIQQAEAVSPDVVRDAEGQ